MDPDPHSISLLDPDQEKFKKKTEFFLKQLKMGAENPFVGSDQSQKTLHKVILNLKGRTAVM